MRTPLAARVSTAKDRFRARHLRRRRAQRAVAAVMAAALFAQPLAPAVTGVTVARAQTLPDLGLDGARQASLAPPSVVPSVAQSQSLPDLGDESQALLAPAQERKFGESVMRQIRAQGGYLDDPEVNDYLNELGDRLVAAVPDSHIDFTFFAVPDPSINAFALPGGFIGVNTGLILLTQTESELASVLGHEISHVTQHHLARMLSAQKNMSLLQIAALALGLALARSAGGDAATAAIASSQALAMQHQINFTRQNEYEADRIGFQRMKAAGFDVTAMATFMERLQRATRFSDGNAPSYLRDHPVTYERIAEAQARADGVPYRQVPDSLSFDLVRALLKSYTGTSREAVTYFDDAIAERKFNNEIAAHYGLVASLLRAKELPRARKELAALEKMAPPHPMIEAIAAHVYLESGDIDTALKIFEAALVRYPNKMQFIYDYPDALLAAHRPRDAAAFIERQLQRFPTDGRLHKSAAQAYAELGNKMEEHRHQAELYAWQGNLPAAVAQLELAIQAGDGDFYQSSVVETRLRALRKELQEQQRENATRNG
jgi:predicted Zn-dependent protease